MEAIEFSRLCGHSGVYIEIVWMSVEQTDQNDSFGVPYLKATKVHYQTIIGDGIERDFTKMRLIDYNEQLARGRVGTCVFHLDDMEKYMAQAHAAISMVLYGI